MPSNRILYPSRSPKKKMWNMRPRWSWIFALSLPIIGIGCIYLTRVPALNISTITISGAETISSEDITAEIQKSLSGNFAFIIPHTFVFAADTQALSQELKTAFPRLSAVSIVKELPKTLRIAVSERKPWGIVCNTTQCAYIDQTGFAFEESPDFSGTLLPKITIDSDITIPQQKIDTALMQQIQSLNENLAKIANAPNVHYELSSQTPREIHVAMPQGFTLYINRDDDFTNVFRVLKSVLQDEIKDKQNKLNYIDLRFGNKVFYKFK